MERDEIEKRVRNETRKIEGIRNRKMVISCDEWNALFGESDSEEEFEGFRAEDIEKCVDEMQQVLESENMVKSHAATGLIENKEAESVKGIKTMVNVVVERLVAFNGDDGLRVANDEEKSVFENMKRVFGDDEWLEVPNLKTQDRRKVNKEVKIVDGLMHNLVKKGMSVT